MTKLYVLEYFFTYYVWPLTVFFLFVFGLCTLIGYIVFKLRNAKNNVLFKSIVKKWSKYALFLYLGIVIISVLFITFANPNHSLRFLDYIYWQVDSAMRNIEPWIMRNGFIMLIILSGLMSLVLLAHLFQQYDFKMSIKAFVIYLLISIPLISGILYLTTQISLIAVVILIGLPGALIFYIKKG